MDLKINSDEFWEKHKQLMLKSFYKNITADQSKTFEVFESVFKQNYYNFIKPLVSEENFNWKSAFKIIQELNNKNLEVSFYISDSLLNEYKGKLESYEYFLNGSDSFLNKNLEKENSIDENNFEIVNENNFSKYQEIVEVCFPNYENNFEYTSFTNLLSKSNSKNFFEVLLKVDEDYVAFGSIAMDQELDTAYLHNMGTLPKFRRLGYFTNLTKYLENKALRNNIKNIYANAEYEGDSFKGFIKMGYNLIDEKYNIFSKVKQ